MTGQSERRSQENELTGEDASQGLKTLREQLSQGIWVTPEVKANQEQWKKNLWKNAARETKHAIGRRLRLAQLMET
jgi:predicted RNA-binding protein YlxR (DUF448 family)